jgi:diguanylate cyclase (GGDEF)-like protein
MNSQFVGRSSTTAASASRSSTSEQFNRLQELFDKSFKAARVGVWECSLPDETLTWTDTVFELFDLDPSSPLKRDDIVALYTPESQKELSQKRGEAIKEGDGFTLDAEIVTAKGNSRWIRITAIVERTDGHPVRIFGMKQDVTAEKLMFDQVRRLTEIDSMTGLASRSKFETVFEELCTCAPETSHGLLLADLDGFKAVNDALGHQAGDECLTNAARRLAEALPEAVLVARLGGDEFAVIHPCKTVEDLQDVGSRIVNALEGWWGTYPNKHKISASVGAAMIAKDAAAKDVFALADNALYAVKGEGKNGLRLSREDRIVSAA